jgi:hypothetical protein
MIVHMQPTAIVIGLWDYGWLSHDSIKLTAAPSDGALLQQYITSSNFHTSFLPSDKDETGIHGPFLIERLKPSDFLPLEETDLEHYLESIKLSERPGEDEAECAKVQPYLRSEFVRGWRCYILKMDERHKELFHDWGFAFCIFREFLFVGPQRDSLERFIIGYD